MVANGGFRDGMTEQLASGCNTAQQRRIDGVGSPRFECVVAVGVELAVRDRISSIFAVASASFVGSKF